MTSESNAARREAVETDTTAESAGATAASATDARTSVATDEPKRVATDQPTRAVAPSPKGGQPAHGTKRLNALTAKQMPRFGWLACLVGAILVSAALFAALGWNWGGFVVLAAVLYLASITLWTLAIEGGQKASNAFWGGLVWCAFLLALIPLISIIYTVLRNGIPGITTFGFFGSDMLGLTGSDDQKTVAEHSAVLGGIAHAMWGSILITLAATIISVPIGLLTSIYLVEYSRGGWFSRTITFLVDVMTGIPSIVAGLFAAAVMMFFFGLANGGNSGGQQIMGITAAIALSVLMIPVVVRSTEEMLRVVPNELREASYAMGIRKWRTILRVVIPTAISGIAAGVTLAIARVIGETAPILVTAGFAKSVNTDLFHNWMMSLPVFIYSQLINPTAPSAPGPSTQRAWGAALTLIIIVMLLNLLARFIAKLFAPKTSGR